MDLRRSRIRVVHVSSAHPAGDPRIFEKQCTALAEAGYDVRLVATEQPPPDASFQVVALRRSSRRLVRMTLGVGRAVMTAVRMRPTIVHLHDPELIPAVPLLRLLGIKVIFDSHEHIAASMSNKPYLPGAVRDAARWATTLLVSFVDRTASGIITATPAIAQDFRNARRTVVQNFPVLDQWTNVELGARHPAQLVYVGGITEGRGAFQMLEAIDRLGDSHGAQLKLAGQVAPELLARMRAHPGWRHTEYLGTLDRPRLAQLVGGSTIGLVVLLPEPNYLRSQPTKMFEYMAAGLPILASDYPLWREFVVSAGVGVVTDPLDVESIVCAAASLLENPEDRVQMGRRGREVVESTRNWEIEAANLVAFYDDLSGVDV